MKKTYQQPKSVVRNMNVWHHLMVGSPGSESQPEYVGPGEPGGFDTKGFLW